MLAPGPLLGLFGALDDAGVTWCLLRGADRLDERGGDVDLLVAPEAMARFHRLATTHGFVRWRAWRVAGQHPYQGYDAEQDRWISLHVTDRLGFGSCHEVVLPEALGVLARRVPLAAGWAAAPADELWVTLAHALLDKHHVHPKHRAHLVALASEAGARPEEHPVARALADAAPSWSATALHRAVLDGDWTTVERLGGVLRRQARRTPKAVVRRVVHRACLLGHRVVEPVRSPGPVVALLAPDGAGKSTLAAGLVDAFPVPARSVYLGVHGADGPLGGRHLPRGAGLLVRVGWLLGRRLRVRAYRARRWYVLLDRHPLDALAAPPAGGRWAARRRALLVRAGPRPDLTLVLDASGALLHARKGEHDPQRLEEAASRYRTLAERLDSAVVLDASASPDAVRQSALEAIWRSQVAGAR